MQASSKRIVSWLGALGTGVMALLSCQSVYQEDSVRTVSLPMASDSASLPDSVRWNGPWENGQGRVVRDATTGRIELDLHLPLDQDTLALELRQMGVRRRTVWCVRSADSTRLRVERSRDDSLGTALLDKFWEHRSVSPINREPATPAGLVRFFASRLLLGDSLFRPLSAHIPDGIASDSVLQETWVAACKSGWPMFRVLASWDLAMDSASLRREVVQLLKRGRIVPADTFALFQSPLRVAGDLTQASVLQGDTSRPTGSFVWAGGLDVQVRAYVRLRNFSTDSIAVSLTNVPSSRDTAWDVAKGVTLIVPLTAASGMDTLVVELRDRQGRYTLQALAPFKILMRPSNAVLDTEPPVVAHAALASTVVWDVSSLDVVWSASDRTRLDSIWIDGGFVALDPTGFYRRKMSLRVGDNQATLAARDSAGNRSFDTIRVKRLADTTHPAALPVSGMATRGLPFDSMRVWVGWTVSDNHRVATCRINHQEVLAVRAATGLVCREEMDLTVGGNIAAIEVSDSTGNLTYDTIRILRMHDTTLPAVQPVPGLGSRTIQFDSSRVAIGWTVSDNHRLVSCRIDGVDVPIDGGICSTTVAPKVGSNRYAVRVQDSTGNERGGVVEILRNKDAEPPKAWVVGPDTIRVPYQDSSIVVRWVVKDNNGVMSSQVDGVGYAAHQDTVAIPLKLFVGTYTRDLSVYDSTGNMTLVSVVVVRGALPPVHHVDTVFYGSPVEDTLVCPGICDSVEISHDRIHWQRVDGLASLDQPGTWYARVYPGRAESQVTLRTAGGTENVFAGVSTSFFLRNDSLFGAGRNDVGQLGLGVRSASPVATALFVRKGVRKVVSGKGFTLMLLSDGHVVGAGAGPLPGMSGASLGSDLWDVATNSVDISAGEDFFQVLDRSGRVWAVGANDEGQLGTGDSVDRSGLVQVASGTSALGAGWSHAVRLDSAGFVWAVGANGSGQLGRLSGRDSRGWHKVDSLADAVYSTMSNTTLYRGADRKVRGLGANNQSQLSGDSGTVVLDPIILYGADAAWAGGGAGHVLVLLDCGDLKVAGSSAKGQLGLASVMGAYGFQWLSGGNAAAAAGWDHSLVLLRSGEVRGMGANSRGELGSGNTLEKRVPTRVLF